MENPMLDFEMEFSEKLKKAFYEGYEAGKKDAEYYIYNCLNTDEHTTNADRIRSMSDEELADELLEWFACFMAVEWSRDMILDCLKKEVTSE